ncbi:ATP synthase subunit E [Roseivivax halodurans JCM 10272]|uniref:ATP synthase subunit E n=2 Tax=Roseivivax halodurans TaxID=93683 RepID=X7EEL5_9RHOB|nr:ATP synthase subunit E [Roseivivax halodurans JCM 10272]
MSCQTGCWALAAGVGFVAFVLMLVVGSYGVIGAMFLGGLAFVVLGFLFSMIFCSPLTKPGERRNPGPGTGVPVSTQSRQSQPHSGAAPASGGTATEATSAAAGSGRRSSAAEAAGTGAAARSSAPTAETAASEPETASHSGPAPTETQEKAAPPAPGAAVATADAEAGGTVKPSKDLPGQRDLEGRKGSWRYEGNSSAQAPGTGPSAGTKPPLLEAPRGEGADDLKRIKGVGPKLEQVVNGLGVYHFDQIANWSESEVAWVDDNLDGFKGRVTRDDWVNQAKILAGGGETDFSRRPDMNNDT